jgi:hypothetical protein
MAFDTVVSVGPIVYVSMTACTIIFVDSSLVLKNPKGIAGAGVAIKTIDLPVAAPKFKTCWVVIEFTRPCKLVK